MEGSNEEEKERATPESAPAPFEVLKTRSESFFNTLENRIREGLPSMEQQDLERIQGFTRKLMSTAMNASILASLAIAGLSINHTRTRYEIKETSTPSGDSYTHEDERTTNIMNYLLGKSELSNEDRIFFYRHAVRTTLELNLLQVPDNLNDLTEQELVDLMVEAYGEMYPSRVKESLPSIVRTELEDSVGNIEFDQALYESIWELQQRVGAPRLRWAAEGENIPAAVMSLTSGHGRAFYDPVSNTVYLTPGNPSYVLVDEDSHAKQFNEQPLTSYARLAYSWVRAGVDSVTKFQDIRASYSQEYHRSGSLESEAHDVIEPALEFEAEDDYSRRVYRKAGIDVPDREYDQ